MLRRLIEFFDSSRWTCNTHNKTFRTERAFDKHFNLNHEPFFIYRCTACGKTSMSIGTLHSHADSHTPWYSFGNFDGLMEYTEVLKITETETASLDEVKEKAEVQ